MFERMQAMVKNSNNTLSHCHQGHVAKLLWPGVFPWASPHVSFQTQRSFLQFYYLKFLARKSAQNHNNF